MPPLTAEQRDANRRAYEEREAIYRLARENECSECGRQLATVVEDGLLKLRCPTSRDHCGYRKLRSMTQMVKDGDAVNPFISARLEQRRNETLVTQYGEETQALTVYGTERHLMTADIAQKIIAHVWPGASPEAVTKAIMISAQYNLNPLMNEVFIVHYKKRDGSGPGSDAVVLGIDGNRKIARRKGAYSYADGPRAMSAQEVVDYGEDPAEVIGAICILKTPNGGLFPGFGFYGRKDALLGADKGNTRINMACMRAERAALRRLMPDNELPAPVNIDAMYADISEIAASAPQSHTTVDRATGEIMDYGTCPVHKKPFVSGQYGPHCKSKMPDGSWCKEKPRVKNPSPEIIEGESREVPAPPNVGVSVQEAESFIERAKTGAGLSPHDLHNWIVKTAEGKKLSTEGETVEIVLRFTRALFEDAKAKIEARVEKAAAGQAQG